MSIHQEVVIPAAPHAVYVALTDGAKFAAMTGNAPAEIGPHDGDTFTLFGGAIHGRHIELVPGERVVQAWRVKSWPPGVFSMVRFTLTADGHGTKVTLDHSGFPAEQEPHLAAGWGKNYWEPLTKALG